MRARASSFPASRCLRRRSSPPMARETSRRPFKRWTKGDDDSPVSEGDIAVNDLLRARLTKLLAGAGWLSEETVELPDRALPLAWVVDPIDGTRAYIAGRADWSISVALVDEGRPRLAALFAPVSEEMFLAVYGEGATLPAYYDAEEAVLVLRRPQAGIQRVDLLTCGTAEELDSVDLPAP